MKKILSVCVLFLLAGFCSCSMQYTTIKQSEKHFADYINTIREIVSSKGLEVTAMKDESAAMFCMDLKIVVNQNADIQIRFSNSGVESESGIESFSIQYTMQNNETGAERFDTELFTDIINSVSGKALSMEFCDAFLEAPEDVYPASDYGYQKRNGERIAKEKPLDFFENWNIFYTLDADYNESLIFGGLTK